MIELRNVSKIFQEKEREILALKDINIEFRNGETAVVVGSSGSGKSTLLRCINGLEAPTKGECIISGEKLSARNKNRLCSKVGMVFQQFNLFPHFSVKDNLIYGPVNVLSVSKKEAEEKSVQILERFGILAKINAMPSHLSGGQKQRVAICRALMMEPEIMLFDEPTSALDPEVIKDIISIIEDLKKTITNIIVTHHLKFAKIVADRIIFMDNGMILADQQKDDFFAKPKSHRARIFLNNVGDLM